MITYNPEGGDLGRALIKPVSALEMKTVIPHVANILEELAVVNNEQHFRYAFELPMHEKDMALMVINTSKLPPHVQWYECDGRKLFEMRGVSGGIVSAHICYLVTK